MVDLKDYQWAIEVTKELIPNGRPVLDYFDFRNMVGIAWHLPNGKRDAVSLDELNNGERRIMSVDEFKKRVVSGLDA